MERSLSVAGIGAFQFKMLVLCGGTQFADALELILLPFLPKVLLDMEPVGNPMHVGASSSTAWLLSFVVFTGMLIGAPLWGYYSDVHGRRSGMMLSSAFVGVAGLSSGLAISIEMLLACRFMVGIGLAGAPCALALFTECLPATRRQDGLVSFFGMFSVGAIACSLTAWWCIVSLQSWRLLLVFTSIPSLFVVIFSFYSVESPLFLVQQGRLDDATKVVDTIMKENGVRIDGDDAAQFIDDSVSDIDEPVENKLLDKSLVFKLCCLFILMAVVYYSLILLSVSYLGDDKPLMDSGQYIQLCMVNFAEIPGLVVALYIIKTKDSRYSISILFGICSLFVLLMGLNHIVASGKLADVLGTIFMFGARASALGFNQSLWIYSSVSFPTHHRTLGIGLVTAAARIGGLLSPFIGNLLFEQFEFASLVICTLLCVTCSFISWKCLPPPPFNNSKPGLA